jgi:hypothetical protein
MVHFEGHGDHWNALGFKDDETLGIIQESIEKGTIDQNHIFQSSEDNSKLIPILYPEHNSIQICSLLISINGTNTVESFYPILEGIRNQVVINEKYTWENNLEGEVEIYRDDKINLYFFAPFFHKNFGMLKKGSKAEVYLAGLAFFVEKAATEYDIKNGDLYEMALNNYLKDNPHKTRKDFPSVSINMDGSIILFPTDEYSVYEYRGKILDLEYVTFFGKNVAKTKIFLENSENENNLYINLYFSGDNVRDCNINIGDNIQCKFWLIGYMQ